jgi:hypothetical protein
MRYSLSYRLTVAGGLCALIAGMAAINGNVREEIARVVSGEAPTPEMAAIDRSLHEFAIGAAHAIRDQSMDHAVLVIFGLGAAVIVLFMLRIRL